MGQKLSLSSSTGKHLAWFLDFFFFFLVYMKQTVLGKENNSLLPVSKSPVVDKSAIQSHRHYLGAIRNLSAVGRDNTVNITRSLAFLK